MKITALLPATGHEHEVKTDLSAGIRLVRAHGRPEAISPERKAEAESCSMSYSFVGAISNRAVQC